MRRKPLGAKGKTYTHVVGKSRHSGRLFFANPRSSADPANLTCASAMVHLGLGAGNWRTPRAPLGFGSCARRRRWAPSRRDATRHIHPPATTRITPTERMVWAC